MMDKMVEEIKSKLISDLNYVHKDYYYSVSVAEHIETLIDTKLAMMLEELSKRLEVVTK